METTHASMGPEPMDPDRSSSGERPAGAPLPPPAPSARARWCDVPIARARRQGAGAGVVAGVVAGLARAYGLDRRLTRFVVVVTTLVLPAVFLAYAAAWFLLPADPAPPESLRQVVTERRRLPLLVVLGVVIVASGAATSTGPLGLHGFGLAAVLIAIGILLWIAPARVVRGAGGSTPPPPWPSAPGPEARRFVAPPEESGADVPYPSTPYPSTRYPSTPYPSTPQASATYGTRVASVAPAAPPRLRPPQRPVGALALAVVTAGLGAAVAGDALRWWRLPTVATVLTVALVLAAATLTSAVVNGRFGRLAFIGPLAAVAVFTAVTGPELTGGVGERTVVAISADALVARQRLAVGRLTLDASALSAAGDAARIDARVGVGQLRIIVPNGAGLELTGRIGAGRIVVDGAEVAAGIRFDHAVDRAPAPGAPVIRLAVRVGVGEILIEHAPAASR